MATLGGEVVKTAVIPLEAWRQHQTEQIKTRLARTREGAEHAAKGRALRPAERVAYKALAEAAISDDELIADYVGGVLAASGPNDDTGAAVVAQIGRLSSLQLRLHYVIYRELRRLWQMNSWPLNLYDVKSNPIIELDVFQALGAQNVSKLQSALYVLLREGLIAEPWAIEPVDQDGQVSTVVWFRTSGPGAELFLWGHGVSPADANRIVDPELRLSVLTDVPKTPKSRIRTPPGHPVD